MVFGFRVYFYVLVCVVVVFLEKLFVLEALDLEMPRVKVNVSGVKYEFDREILNSWKYHTLTKMCNNAADGNKTPIELVVDRPSDCFAAILNYYQTNELHMPPSVCPSAFRTELKFWSVAPTDLEPCCLYR